MDVTVNGARLHVETSGPDGGEPILFLHGLLWGGWMFEPQVTALSDRFRCVTLDWRGQGKSEVTADGYDMESLTKDAIAVIDQLKLAPVHLVGLSMGGFVSMRIAARRPELVRSLSLLETSADPEPPENVPRYRRLNLVARWLGLAPVAGKVMPIMFAKSTLADPTRAAELAEWRRRLIANDRIGITRAVKGVIDRAPIHAELGAVRAPTLVMVGEEDAATVPAKAERIRDAIKGARLVRVPRAGHTSTLENPTWVTRELRAFLESVRG